MSAPDRIWIDPTGITEGHTDDPAEVNERDVAYIRADLAHTAADLERAVKAALEAAAKDAASKALFGYMDRSDRYAGGVQAGVYRMSKAIRALDPAEIVRAAREGGE